MATVSRFSFIFVFTLILWTDHEARGSNSDNFMAPTSSHQPNNKKSVICWILGFSGGTVAGIICGIISLLLFMLATNMAKGKKNDFGLTIFSQLIKAQELAFLNEDDAVASLQLIGKGGCGAVYKAELPLGKVKTIAIKKVILPSGEDDGPGSKESIMGQLNSEIKTVGQIRHRNLVPLLAHVSGPNCHYLVFEFMKNGSLHHILKQVRDGSRELDWLSRHRIALGVAAGLEYLHMSHTPRIVHRDLKPDNVLLDEDMEALITDFGLAELIPDADTHIWFSGIAGTFGYIAPEYFQSHTYTEKCDIYSFGVILASLVMGNFTQVEYYDKTQGNLRNAMTCEDPKQFIDPILMGNGYEEQMVLVLKIASFCTLVNPDERPNSKEARLMLAQIEH